MIFGEENAQPAGGNPGGQQQQQQQVRVDTSSMSTLYANFFALAGAQDEITVYLGASSPMPGSPQPLLKLDTRVLLQPQAAKRLALALQQAVSAHEDRFGPIELPPQPGQQPPAGDA